MIAQVPKKKRHSNRCRECGHAQGSDGPHRHKLTGQPPDTMCECFCPTEARLVGFPLAASAKMPKWKKRPPSPSANVAGVEAASLASPKWLCLAGVSLKKARKASRCRECGHPVDGEHKHVNARQRGVSGSFVGPASWVCTCPPDQILAGFPLARGKPFPRRK